MLPKTKENNRNNKTPILYRQGESMPLLISSPIKKLHCPRFKLRHVPPTNAFSPCFPSLLSSLLRQIDISNYPIVALNPTAPFSPDLPLLLPGCFILRLPTGSQLQ
ncbi:hypothetical protein J3E68DRAFT_354023 [Trichoderma sp. SZMC 28012]